MTITVKQALKALDDMDDYAKMDCSVSSIGAYRVLERFIRESMAQCQKGDLCQCGGDTPQVRKGCSNWIKEE